MPLSGDRGLSVPPEGIDDLKLNLIGLIELTNFISFKTLEFSRNGAAIQYADRQSD
jgi:hypothetical protein